MGSVSCRTASCAGARQAARAVGLTATVDVALLLHYTVVMVHPPTSFRLDPALLARVDDYAATLARATGVPVSRHAAMAKLLTFALDANEEQLRKRNEERKPKQR